MVTIPSTFLTVSLSNKDLKQLKYRSWHLRLSAKLLILCFGILMGFGSLAMAAPKTLTVSTDRQQVEMGDIVNLVIQTDFQTFDSLDLSSLKDQFQVLGTQRSSNITIINGQYQALTRWDVSISPKQVGELMIPPLTVDGVTSQPYKLTVTPVSTSHNKGVSFLESSVDKTRVHVQQQVIYTLKFYHLGQLIDGNTRPPLFGNAIQKQLKNQVNYQTKINDQVYDVYEWSWAFYPQTSGKLTIPAEEFRGRLQYNDVIKMLKDSSQPIDIDVEPKASTFPQNETWLPAKNVTLTDDWQVPSTLHVGDAITRTLTLTAQGLMSSQLPDLPLNDQAEFHLYPDQPKLSDDVTDKGVDSKKLFKVAIVPMKAGKITLPKMTLHWWNTQTQHIETLTLPEKTLEVMPAITAQGALPSFNAAPAGVSHETQASAHSAGIWPYLTGLFVLLWLITLLLFWRMHRQGKRSPTQAMPLTSSTEIVEPNLLKRLGELSETGDAKHFYKVLNLWIHENIVTAEREFSEPVLADALLALKAHLFNHSPLPEHTLTSIMQHLRQSTAQNAKSSSRWHSEEGKKLDPLYPTSE